MRIRILLLCLIPFCSLAQDEKPENPNLTELSGKWEEKMRLKKKKELEFQDTLRLEIRTDGFMMMRYNIGPTLMGEAYRKGNSVYFKNRVLEVVEQTKGTLKLRDDDGTHIFTQVDEFNQSPVDKKMPQVESGRLYTRHQEELVGKWTCYKKTDPSYDKQRFYIKTLNLKEKRNEKEYSGTITLQNMDSVFTSDCRMFLDKKSVRIHVDADGRDMLLQTEMLLENEWVLVEDKATYYLKMLGK